MTLLSRRFVFFLRFEDITCFQANIEKMAGDGLLGGVCVSVIYARQADKIPVLDFFDNFDVFKPVCPAFNAVPFHGFIIGGKDALLEIFSVVFYT